MKKLEMHHNLFKTYVETVLGRHAEYYDNVTAALTRLRADYKHLQEEKKASVQTHLIIF